MVATFWLLSWALAPMQPITRPVPGASQPRADWALSPHLVRGQELVYRGSFSEDASGARVQFQRHYRVESRIFVLDAPPRGFDLAALTIVSTRGTRPGTTAESAVRIEKVQLDLQGKVSVTSDVSLTVPLDAPPTLEIGAFVPLPRSRVTPNQTWEISEPGRPVQHWRVLGSEAINGHHCVKLAGVQQSEDWDRPRADRSSWRRQDTVWVAARMGLAQRFERVIEHREPARLEIAQRSVLRCDLDTNLQYPGQMAQDRRQEIVQAFSFREAAQPLVGEPIRNSRALQVLQRRIATHLENQPPTPYRHAVQQIKTQVDAACRGEVIAARHDEPTRAVQVATIGELAPEFVAGPISSSESGRLSRWRGKPIVLVFYNPASSTAEELLRFTQDLHTHYHRNITVVGLAVSGDTTSVLKQREALHLGFPIYSGGGMRISYGVETTPKVVLIDPRGVIRSMHMGWGQQTTAEIMGEVRRWLPGQ